MTKTEIKTFQEIYFKEYWVEISEEKAKELWEKFLMLIKTVLFSNWNTDDRK